MGKLRRSATALIAVLLSAPALADGPTFVGGLATVGTDLATSYPYTEDPLVPRITRIRRVHVTELRAAVATIRQQAGLAAFAWTDPQPTRIRAIHVNELRTALAQAFAALNRPAPVWSEPVVALQRINARHFQEIRDLTRWEASGTIATDTTWTAANSPYIVQGEVFVTGNATLTIEAGTVVKLTTAASLHVLEGSTLRADGTADRPIVFTSTKDDSAAGDTNRDGTASQPKPGDWAVLGIGSLGDNSQPAFGSLTHVEVRYGTAFRVRFSAPALRDFQSTFMSGDGLYLEAPPDVSYTLDRLTLADNFRNVHLNRVPVSTTIRNSLIRRSTGVAVQAVQNSAAQLLHNSIDGNNGGGGIIVDGSSPITLRYNSITNNRTSEGWARGIQASGCCATVDARENWWGSTTGPEVFGQPQTGGGGQIGPNVLYDPWLGQFLADGFKAGDHPWTVKAGVGVDVATGNFHLVEKDLSIPTIGFPLEIIRTYNNKIAGGTLTDLGVGWMWNYGTELRPDADPDPHRGLVWHREDGAETYFKRLPDDTFSSEEGVYEKLAWSGSTYRMTRKDQSVLVFNAAGKLTAQIDPAGNTTTIARDAGGRVLQVVEPMGRALTFEYDGPYLSRITDPAGRTFSYQRNPNGAISNVRKADSGGNVFGVTDYSYGPGGAWEMTGFDDADGNRLQQSFDDAIHHRVAEQRFNNNGVVRFAYGPTTSGPYSVPDFSTLVWDNRGRAHHYFHTKSNKVTDHYREEVPPGGVPEWIHDDAWRYAGYLVATYTGPDGTTESTYDWNNGNLVKLVKPGGRTTTHTYDAFNNRTSTTDPLGRRTSYEYNAQQRLVKTTDALGHITQRWYDAKGLPQWSTDELGHLTTFSYDDYGYPKSTANHLGHTTRFTHDVLGRKTTETDPLNRRSGANYDARGNPLDVFNALDERTSFNYDAKGRRTRRVDAEGRETRYAYDDSRNALVRTTNALGGTVDLTLDVAGNVASVRDPRGFVTTFTYDDLNRKIAETDPLNRTWKYTYIRRNLLSTVTDAKNERTDYLYDSANELAQVNYADGTSATYTHDLAGNRVGLVDWTGETRWDYDALNRPIEVRKNGVPVRYSWDAAGNLSALTYPGSKTVVYTYDEADRMTLVAGWTGRATTYTYDAAGQLKTYRYENGVVALRDYDQAGRLQYLQYARNNNVFASMGYTFDRVGNRTSKRTTVGGDVLEAYAYDELYRVRDVYYADTNSRLAFAYDASGNRTTKWDAPNGGPYVITFTGSYDDADQLLGDAATARFYDANGAQTADGPRSHVWNAQHRLRETSYFGTVTSFLYDADGRRVRQTHGGAVTDYVVNPVPALPEVLMETAGGVTKYHIYGHDLLYTIEPSGLRFLHADALGSTVAGTNGAGEVEARYTYDIFGTLRGTTNFNWTQRRFTGEENDETGLTYLRARYYHPVLGRFLSRDPFPMDFTETQGINRYVYVQNNPVTLVDPSGENPVAIAILAGALLGVLNQLAIDLAKGNGEWSTPAEYAAAGVGGAAAAIVAISMPWAAAPSGAVITSSLQQGIGILDGSQQTFDDRKLFRDLGSSLLFDRIPGARVPVVSQGRNSWAAVGKQMVTKATRGQIANVRLRTGLKMFVGGVVPELFGTWTEGTLSGWLGR
ncbi:MAG TPA: RHS repeat-associated core domain-containing protein [Thermoanaerobaculia bacterium]